MIEDFYGRCVFAAGCLLFFILWVTVISKAITKLLLWMTGYEL